MNTTTAIPKFLLFSEDFVISAGSVLFRVDPKTIPESIQSRLASEEESQTARDILSHGNLQICILHYTPKGSCPAEWLLPKGRKDVDESIQTAAVRETFEETGYPCVLLPTQMQTRAPIPETNSSQNLGAQLGAHFVEGGCAEPIAVQVRPTPNGSHVEKDDEGNQKKVIKFVWWYIAVVANPFGEKQAGSQMEYEDFESIWVDADEAIEKLSHDEDSDVAAKALALVKESYRK